ncbi:MAG: 30S ribosomal protein S6--L-glutamate ligase [Sandaracinus sp.]|nr:30S ribosomal protein S6--L-glutamate ligase [Sandaracinus sp.]|tara:strand:+ start:2192 stop:3343 length:1152 start_codon:yes stop_codon:yes gene_type:complete
MNITVLSRGPDLYSTRRLVEAAEARGHAVQVCDTLEFSMHLEQGRPTLRYRNEPFDPPDAVIPRIGASITFYGCAVVRQFEQMGVFTLSGSHAIGVSRDKLRSLQMLSRFAVGMPNTAFVRRRDQVEDAIAQVGGAPVIVKVLEGTQGVGVILAETQKTAQAIIETLQMAKQNVLIQKFVAEAAGSDIRAFVVGGKVVAAMRRTAKEGEYRSNVHQGGKAKRADLSPDFEKTAIGAAQIMGLRVAGVDMLEGENGPKVMEVNSSPGLEGIEGATGIDIADTIIAHLEDEVPFPDLDIRQRLTLRSGYGVTEIVIGPTSPLANRTVRSANLSAKDVRILTIIRDDESFPNPNPDREMLPGDRVLCFGSAAAIRTLIPPRSIIRG